MWGAAKRDKNVEKVHKPPLGVNVINFELNGFNASIYTDIVAAKCPQTPKNYNALVEVFKFI